jgi:hypothetical protein
MAGLFFRGWLVLNPSMRLRAVCAILMFILLAGWFTDWRRDALEKVLIACPARREYRDSPPIARALS